MTTEENLIQFEEYWHGCVQGTINALENSLDGDPLGAALNSIKDSLFFGELFELLKGALAEESTDLIGQLFVFELMRMCYADPSGSASSADLAMSLRRLLIILESLESVLESLHPGVRKTLHMLREIISLALLR